jgi:hypothetical protein
MAKHEHEQKEIRKQTEGGRDTSKENTEMNRRQNAI